MRFLVCYNIELRVRGLQERVTYVVCPMGCVTGSFNEVFAETSARATHKAGHETQSILTGIGGSVRTSPQPDLHLGPAGGGVDDCVGRLT
jgi:hypothetical protein